MATNSPVLISLNRVCEKTSLSRTGVNIRRATDRGVLVVCDPRLARASYRGPFRAALPVEPSLWKDPRELAREAGAFLAGGERVPMEEDP